MISVFNGRSRGLGSENSEEVYVQVSVALRRYLHLFKGAKFSIFMCLALHSDKFGWSKPSISLISSETGVERKAIFRALTELCELTIDGHRILLRKTIRRHDGGRGNNRYLIFPTTEEIQKFETPSLFPEDPVEDPVQNSPPSSQNATTPSPKKGTYPSSQNATTPVAKRGHEVDPDQLEPSVLQKSTEEPLGQKPHTQDLRAGAAKTVCVKSKFDLETIREYAWASHGYDEWYRRFEPKSKLEGIRNPEGWSIAAQRSGEFDPVIQEFVDDPEMFETMRRNSREARH